MPEGQNSVYGEPHNSQAEHFNTSPDNATAHVGPYVDQDLTKRNVAQADDFVPTDSPKKSGSKTQGNIRRYYAEDQVEEILQTASNEGVDPPPHSPNSWKIRKDADDIPRARDPYTNNGMIGQNYLNNG